jgi:hypothetical protein
MIPRGQLDIGLIDLCFALWHCLVAILWQSAAQQRRRYATLEQEIAEQWTKALSAVEVDCNMPSLSKQSTTCSVEPCEKPPLHSTIPNVMVGLSVRSLLDLYLRVQKYPAGSEVIVSPPINVPGMLAVLEFHQLKVVGVDIRPTTQ